MRNKIPSIPMEGTIIFATSEYYTGRKLAFLDTNRYLRIVRNPELTRSIILETACELFNSQGYKATSISDITEKAKLTKGAIYRHFQDKSSLEKEALRTMCNKMLGDISSSIKQANDSKAKLYCILEYFSAYGKKPPFKGGCPLMNAAIEADDNNTELKMVVQFIMGQIHEAICRIIKNGIAHGQIRKGVKEKELSSLMIGSLEGSVMMMKVFDNNVHLNNCIKYLQKEIDSILI